MNEDVEKRVVEFNNEAAKLYSHIFNQFHSTVRNVERNDEENVFQMQVSKFSLELRKQLDLQIKTVLETSDLRIYEQLQAALSATINYYLQEFIQKCNSL